MSEFADWTRAFVMMGDSPVGIREVLLAEDGSMYALLQGETVLGALQTVRLDSEGRLSAFIIDSTDAWGRMLSIGNAELATRLGSPVRYDQQGHLYYADSFEYGRAGWTNDIDGLNAAVALTPESAAMGGYSIKLTAGSSLGHYAAIYFRCGLLPAGKMGITVAFAPAQEFTTFELLLTAETGVEAWQGRARFDYTDNAIDVYAAPGNWEEAGVAEIAMLGSKVFNVMKLVIDVDAGKYTRVMLNEYEYGVSTHALMAGIPEGGRWAEMRVLFEGRDEVNDVCYVDNIIMTTGEPE